MVGLSAGAGGPSRKGPARETVMRRRVCLRAVAVAMTLAAGPASAATEIELWHAMSGANTERIEAIAEGFNKPRPTTRSSPLQGQLRRGADSRHRRVPRRQPAGHPAGAGGRDRHLHGRQGCDTPGRGGDEGGGGAVRPQVLRGRHHRLLLANDGQMLSFPFNSSTPVLYYNKDLSKGGAGPRQARRRPGRRSASIPKKLRATGVPCGYTTTWISWIQLENLGAVTASTSPATTTASAVSTPS